jgi:hypothetical protein
LLALLYGVTNAVTIFAAPRFVFLFFCEAEFPVGGAAARVNPAVLAVLVDGSEPDATCRRLFYVRY